MRVVKRWFWGVLVAKDRVVRRIISFLMRDYPVRYAEPESWIIYGRRYSDLLFQIGLIEPGFIQVMRDATGEITYRRMAPGEVVPDPFHGPSDPVDPNPVKRFEPAQ